VRAAFTATTGFTWVTSRAIRVKCRGLPKLSRYIRITDVLSSSFRYSSTSLPEMSALLPRLMNLLTPIPYSRA
jgi:hypothetical protein